MIHFIPGGGNALSTQPKSFISSLFCLKTLCAFFVVCIHFSVFAPGLYPLIRTAVPAFFMISGYFIYSSDRLKAISCCKRSLRKIILITVAANLFYLPVQAGLFLAGGKVTLPQLNPESILYFILVGDNISAHLWYLTAYIQVLLVVFAVLVLKMENPLRTIIPLGMLAGLLFGTYSFLLPHYHPLYFLLSRNFLTIGIPFFGLGYLIRKYEPLIMQKKFRILGHPAACLLFLILSVAEARALVLVSRGPLMGDILFFTIPLTVSLFLFCLQRPNLGRGSFVETIGKKYTTDIYIFHTFVGVAYGVMAKRLSTLVPLPEMLSPVFVFLLALLFSILFKRLLSRLRLSLSPSE